MRGDRTAIVGLLLPNIVNEFYARYANALAVACEEHALHLIIHLTGDDILLERRALQRLVEVQAGAVVMVPAPGDWQFERPLLKSMRVIQLIRHRVLEQPASSVLIDDSTALAHAVGQLAAKNHRKIAYVGGEATLSSGAERLAAFLNGLSQAGLGRDETLEFTDAPSFDLGRSSAKAILDRGDVDAVVCGGFEISNGILSALLEADRSLNSGPEFVGYGDPGHYKWIGGGVSTIGLPVEELAARTLTCLTAEQQAATHSLPANLILRGKMQSFENG
nr:substrate-binding domain-containing protein [Shimia biformata]